MVNWLTMLYPFLVVNIFSMFIPCVYPISMNLERKHEIFDLCYSLTSRNRVTYGTNNVLINGQEGVPLASSVENLIALIEKLENSTALRSVQAKDLAVSLLKKFRSDGNIVRAFTRLEQEEIYERVDKIEDTLLEQVQGFDFDDKNILSENERCSLYFMLSYNINRTEKAVTSSYGSTYRAPSATSSRTPSSSRYGTSNTNTVPAFVKPREYGVGSYRSNGKQAIALNRLLLGVIAGFQLNKEFTVYEVFSKLDPDNANKLRFNSDGMINPLIAVTLGNLHALVAHVPNEPDQIGFSGLWNSVSEGSYCPTEYSLDKANPSIATLANLRGGVDGYLIGQLVQKLIATPAGLKLKLSQILRFYYDNVGARMLGDNSNYCTRSSATIDERSVRETATNYYKVLEASKDYYIEELILIGSIEKLRSAMESALRAAKEVPSEDMDWCNAGQNTFDVQCETPTDLFIAIDMQSADKSRYKNLTARLVSNLNLGIAASSVSILSLNTEDGGGIGSNGQIFQHNLKHITWASYNKGCPGCALAYTREDNLGSYVSAPSADFYTRVNDTLRDFEMTKAHLTGTPGKPFILMGGQFSSKNMDANIRQARYNLKAHHRDVPIYLVTTASENDLSDYIYSSTDIIRDQDALDIMTNEMSEKICSTPATFQYPDCSRTSSESNSAFEGFITPGRTQHWAMYPEYFIKSFGITMKFTSTEGNLKVYYGRYPKPKETGRKYPYDKDSAKEIIIEESNPCKDRDLLTCEPFYFTIEADEGTPSTSSICSDKRCLNAKQIKFKFTHVGIQCSSAWSLFSSFSINLAAILTILSFFNRYINQF